ncbi:MAG: Outer-membrane lipoprotein carrier protein [Candidatus Scalindua arabica]|uniref:Outer-membrane lipoprotein carrier protein n=1 Tax=Candidatus Scalindua arabica TaxID=1127984 RepID=A0A941W1V5_9BACT|nr:Outer-membrane lipoprotein carrier protein [Candidatus Scalindua arabica]
MLESVMFINKISYIILALTFGSLMLNPAVSSGSDSVGDYDLDEILVNVEGANSRLKTMEAEIKYSRVITLLDSEEVSVGFLQFKKPKLINVNFFPPRNEINVIDGSYLWIYHIEERQVEKYEMSGDDSPQGVDIFELGYDYTAEKVKTNYEVTLLDVVSTEEETLFHLELIPRATFDSEYDRTLLWIKEGLWLPVQYQLFESDGEIINTIHLTHIEINTEISDDEFVLNLSDDVDIIEPFK